MNKEQINEDDSVCPRDCKDRVMTHKEEKIKEFEEKFPSLTDTNVKVKPEDDSKIELAMMMTDFMRFEAKRLIDFFSQTIDELEAKHKEEIEGLAGDIEYIFKKEIDFVNDDKSIQFLLGEVLEEVKEKIRQI